MKLSHDNPTLHHTTTFRDLTGDDITVETVPTDPGPPIPNGHSPEVKDTTAEDERKRQKEQRRLAEEEEIRFEREQDEIYFESLKAKERKRVAEEDEQDRREKEEVEMIFEALKAKEKKRATEEEEFRRDREIEQKRLAYRDYGEETK